MFYRTGVIEKLDYATARARVVFRAERGRTTGENFALWLAVLQTRTKEDAYYTMPDAGETVACLLSETFEDGVILGGLYTEKNKPKNSMVKNRAVIEFSDGTKIQYDRGEKKLLIDAVGDITIKSASGTVKVEAMTVDVNATTANITASGGSASLLDTFTGLTSHIFVPNA
jgi:phage baseplate assembly protein V